MVAVDELFDEWERAWSGREPSGFEPLCAEGFQYEDPLTPEPLHGRGRAGRPRGAAVGGVPRRAAGRGPASAWPAARSRARRASCSARTASRSAASRPTGRFLVVHAVVYAELREGRLLRARAFFDVHDAGDAARPVPEARHGRPARAADAPRLRAAQRLGAASRDLDGSRRERRLDSVIRLVPAAGSRMPATAGKTGIAAVRRSSERRQVDQDGRVIRQRPAIGHLAAAGGLDPATETWST